MVTRLTYESSTNALSSLPRSSYTPDILESLLASDNICDHDAIAFVDQAGVCAISLILNLVPMRRSQLHASDLRSLPRSSVLAQTLRNAASSIELPYMRRSIDNPLTNIAHAVAKRCSATPLSVSSGELGPQFTSGEKYVVSLEMPAVSGSSQSRKQLMEEYGTHL